MLSAITTTRIATRPGSSSFASSSGLTRAGNVLRAPCGAVAVYGGARICSTHRD